MATHTFTKTWSNGTSTSSAVVSVTADAEFSFDFSLTSAQVDKEYDIDFVHTRLKGIFITSSKDITIETNATDATGGDTIPVNGGEGFAWTENDLADNPFTAAVTKMYLTNGEASACTGSVKILYDNSP